MSEESLPDEKDLLELPRWARVYFAARCAERAYPAIGYLSEEAKQAVNTAICTAYLVAGAASYEFDNRAADAARVIRAIDTVDDAAYAAAYAADAAQVIQIISSMRTTDATVNATVNAAAKAAQAAQAAARAAETEFSLSTKSVFAEIIYDYHNLLSLARENGWTDDTRIPRDTLEPICPSDSPDVPPTGEQSQPPSGFEFYINPGNASKETIQDVFHALNELHRAHGGLGFEFREDGNYNFIAEEVYV